ncbi:septal ring lytic transglycosylase RlpA family protein [Chelativorans sp. M5D2P16]|uniref:septal ring lytic transglycosylase RlpA family protein n=1 Tax=Chelativorans sp. M5D2P16 TaxID=3095678 RepID=UPI002ACA54AF|nr:septal ring lytic transglycosylase RlpA family protein [Chelativorans sp. M5D2P16]MDZ5697713.1 septal ring lytic transglycosylase RlpA family protein [Chelativorans sp. M5D2P16]
MHSQNRRGQGSLRLGVFGVGALALAVSACSMQTPTADVEKSGTSEYFAESEYGVKASPRVAQKKSGLRRGGGRHQVGKPYKVKGRWYRPELDPDYVAEGAASWYGAAFHGRLTANGEVYDMTHLTAAHPTMPLPSYARVTNLANGSSVMVRVNDRGPFAAGRVIDLSKKAAEMLGYKNDGVAKVRVEYAGAAPLHGQDDQLLMASYRPGDAAPDPSDGLPSGVMLAMNGSTPTQPVVEATSAFAAQPQGAASVSLPNTGPMVPDRPQGAPMETELALLSYADHRVQAASRAFDALLEPELDSQALTDWWARDHKGGDGEAKEHPVINLGTFSSQQGAEDIARAMSGYGAVTVERTAGQADWVYALSLAPREGADLDMALRAAWTAGAKDAFAVRE